MTPKQARFVAEYLVDGNGTQAAIRAGYSPNRADVTASELLREEAILTALDVGKRKVTERTIITAQMVLERAWQVANSDAKDRGAHLAIAARAFPEFRESVTIDNRQQTLVLPEGTTLEDIKRLRDGLNADNAHS